MITALHSKSKNAVKIKGIRAGRSSPTATVAMTASHKPNHATTGAGHKKAEVTGLKKGGTSTQIKATPCRLTGVSPDHRDDDSDNSSTNCHSSEPLVDDLSASKKEVCTDHRDDVSETTALITNKTQVEQVPTSENFALPDDQSDLTDCESLGANNDHETTNSCGTPLPLDDAPTNTDKSRRNESSNNTNESVNVFSDNNVPVDTSNVAATAYQARTLNANVVLGGNLSLLHSLAIQSMQEARAELDTAREVAIGIGKAMEQEVSSLATAVEKDISELVVSSPQEDTDHVVEDKLPNEDESFDAKTLEEEVAFEIKDDKVEDTHETPRTEADCLPTAKGCAKNGADDPLSQNDESRNEEITALTSKTDNATDSSVDPQASGPNTEYKSLPSNSDNAPKLSQPSNRRKKSRSTYKIDKRLRKIMPNFLIYGIEVSEEGITGGVTIYCENHHLSTCGVNVKKGADRLCLTPMQHTHIDEMVGLQHGRAVTIDLAAAAERAKAEAEAKAKAEARARAQAKAQALEKEDTATASTSEIAIEIDPDCRDLATSCFCFDEEIDIELFECECEEEDQADVAVDDTSVFEEDGFLQGSMDFIALKAFQEMKSIIKELEDDDSSLTSSTCSSIEMDTWLDVIHEADNSGDEVEVELDIIEADHNMNDSETEDFMENRHEGKTVVQVVYDSETDDEPYY